MKNSEPTFDGLREYTRAAGLRPVERPASCTINTCDDTDFLRCALGHSRLRLHLRWKLEREGIPSKMAGRNRGPPHLMKGGPRLPIHDPPFARGMGPVPPHPAHLDDLRDGPPFFRGGARPPPQLPPAAIIEERLAAQHHEIQGLLVDNQRLAATHVALKQEVAAAQHELQLMVHSARAMEATSDLQLRELFEKSMKMEADLGAAEAMRAELMQVRADIQKLSASRQELAAQVQALTQDLSRANADLQQAPALKGEIDSMKQELQRARAAIEYEKKAHAENYEHGQAMEKNLILMARDVEKLRAEIANAEKRAHATAAAVNPGYGGNYGSTDAGYGGNLYPAAGYAMNPVVQKALLNMDMDLDLGVHMTCSELMGADEHVDYFGCEEVENVLNKVEKNMQVHCIEVDTYVPSYGREGPYPRMLSDLVEATGHACGRAIPLDVFQEKQIEANDTPPDDVSVLSLFIRV
ncbi:hypothetical protein ACLOJK_039367 [Asimina triloba]